MKNEIKTAFKTTIFMCISTVIILLLVSGIYYKFHISDSKIMAGVVITYFLSAFIGGFIYGKIKEKNKYLYGIMIGIAYFAVLLIISAIHNHGINLGGTNVLYAFLSCFLGGMTGGMFS